MIAVIQRVKQASVKVDNQEVASISSGLLVLIGVHKDDSEKDATFLSNKIPNMRIFADENDKMNYSVIDIRGEILIVSQFTLCADCLSGRRPSFTDAAPPEKAEPLIRLVANKMRELGIPVKLGIFGAKMEVSLINDGPVTFVLNSRP